jgi:hypothetical protein
MSAKKSLGVIGSNLCQPHLSIFFEIHRNERWSLVLIWRVRSVLPSPIDRAGCPTVAGQRRNLHTVDDSALEGWIEVAYRLFIKVDDATRFERPDIVYLNDGALLGDFNKGVGGPIVFAVARQFSISLIGLSLSISLIGLSLSGWPEQAGANFLILGLSFPAGVRSAPRRRKEPTLSPAGKYCLGLSRPPWTTQAQQANTA